MGNNQDGMVVGGYNETPAELSEIKKEIEVRLSKSASGINEGASAGHGFNEVASSEPVSSGGEKPALDKANEQIEDLTAQLKSALSDLKAANSRINRLTKEAEESAQLIAEYSEESAANAARIQKLEAIVKEHFGESLEDFMTGFGAEVVKA